MIAANWSRPGCRAELVAAVLLVASSSLVAQQPTPDPAAAEPIDALRCWRRVEGHAVRIGEPFAMIVTCRVIETENERAVPSDVALAPESLDVTPFEVVEGQRFADVVDGPRRFFQYRYALRLVGEEYLGADVAIPPLEIDYRIERRLDAGVAAVPGREVTYVLPAEPIRILSLVPAAAIDIGGPSLPGFGSAESRRLRANLATGIGIGLSIVAVGLLAAGVLRTRHDRQGRRVRRPRSIPRAALANHVARELSAAQDDAAIGGWSDELLARAVAALRLAGALATGRAITQTRMEEDTPAREGQLAVRHGLLRPGTTLLSSAVTTQTLAATLDAPGHATRLPGGPVVADQLRTALASATAARYGLSTARETADGATLVLDDAVAAARSLRIRLWRPVRAFAHLETTARRWWRRWTH